MVKKLSAQFELGGVSFVSGHHGAGKSSLFKAVVGAIKSSGEVWIGTQVYLNRTPSKMLDAGVTFVPEGRSIFPKLTVRENLLFGSILGKKTGELKNEDLFFPQFEHLLDEKAFTLSGGQAQMLSVLIGLMTKPKYLFLDEPFAGLSRKPAGILAEKLLELALSHKMSIIVSGEKNNFFSSCIDKELRLKSEQAFVL